MYYRGRSLKTLVVLGCGATLGASFVRQDAAYAPPVDKDFFAQLGEAAKAGSIASEAKKALDQAVEGAHMPPYEGVGMEEYFVRAEFTKALRVHMATSNAGEEDHLRGHYAKPVAAYRRAVVALLLETTAGKHCSHHQAIADALEPGDAVVNFNYDTVMDDAMEQATGFETDLGHRDVRLTDVRGVLGCAKKQGRAFLLHLHGALNWSVSPQDLDDAHDFRYECINWVELTDIAKSSVAGRSTDGLERCFIVPPLWTKPIAGCQLLENLWAIARMAVRKCERLIVIGYSMPKTDQLTDYMFQIDTRLRATERLQELVVVNPLRCVQNHIVGKLAGTNKEPSSEPRLCDKTLAEFAANIRG